MTASTKPQPASPPVGTGTVALLVLVLQMSSLTIFMHASRTQGGGSGGSVAAVVLITELVKLGACLSFAAVRQSLAGRIPLRAIALSAVAVARSAGPLALPALLFTLAQQLNLLAAAQLDAVTFQVTNQLKILPTAAFSVATLGRALRPQQWLSLPLLALGVAVVNLSASAHAPPAAALETLSREAGGVGPSRAISWWAGLGAALAAALCSGYASVAVERLLKTEEAVTAEAEAEAEGDAAAEEARAGKGVGMLSVSDSMFALGAAEADAEHLYAGHHPPHTHTALHPHPRAASAHVRVRESPGRPLLTLNVQLSAWGALAAVACIAGGSGGLPGAAGLTDGFNAYTWAVVGLQALGGLVVGVVLKYSDNIVKGFATAASILLSTVLESAALHRLPSLAFVLGLALTCISFALFSGPDDILGRVFGPRAQAATAAAAAEAGAMAAAITRAAGPPPGGSPRAASGTMPPPRLLAAGGVAVLTGLIVLRMIGSAGNPFMPGGSHGFVPESELRTLRPIAAPPSPPLPASPPAVNSTLAAVLTLAPPLLVAEAHKFGSAADVAVALEAAAEERPVPLETVLRLGAALEEGRSRGEQRANETTARLHSSPPPPPPPLPAPLAEAETGETAYASDENDARRE